MDLVWCFMAAMLVWFCEALAVCAGGISSVCWLGLVVVGCEFSWLSCLEWLVVSGIPLVDVFLVFRCAFALGGGCVGWLVVP